MKRRLALVALFSLAQVGMVVSFSGAASASVLLSGSTSCHLVSGYVNFIPGLTASPPNGIEETTVYGVVTCNTPNVLPAVTTLTGVFKGIIKFKKIPAPDKAQKCSHFKGASPVDQIVGGSQYIVNWNTNLGAAVHSVVTYLGAYSAVGTATTLNLNFSPATAAVSGSFAGTIANLDYILPIIAPQCPIPTGVNNAAAGSFLNM
jgi:hypothetical protein